jgi:sugar fermentation stimulation protein A
MEAKAEGHGACILVMALRPCRCFMPHPERDEAFKKAFHEALKAGVEFRGFHIKIAGNEVLYDGTLPLCRGS